MEIVLPQMELDSSAKRYRNSPTKLEDKKNT